MCAVALLIDAPTFAQAAGIRSLGRAELLPVHVPAMSVGVVGMLTGVCIARYCRKKNKGWLRLHKSVQWTAATVAVLGVATGAVMVQNTGGNHFRAPHAVPALVSLILVAATISAAYAFLNAKRYKKQTRVMHRWLGRATIASFLVTIVFGLSAAGLI